MEFWPPHLFAQLFLPGGSNRLAGSVPGGTSAATCSTQQAQANWQCETGREAGWVCGSVVRCSHVAAAGLNPCSPRGQGHWALPCMCHSPRALDIHSGASTWRQVLKKGLLSKLGNKSMKLLLASPLSPPLLLQPELPRLSLCLPPGMPSGKLGRAGFFSLCRSESKFCFCATE